MRLLSYLSVRSAICISNWYTKSRYTIFISTFYFYHFFFTPCTLFFPLSIYLFVVWFFDFCTFYTRIILPGSFNLALKYCMDGNSVLLYICTVQPEITHHNIMVPKNKELSNTLCATRTKSIPINATWKRKENHPETMYKWFSEFTIKCQ